VFIVSERARCVLAILVVATALFLAGVMFLVLKAGDGFLTPALQKVPDGVFQPKGRPATA